MLDKIRSSTWEILFVLPLPSKQKCYLESSIYKSRVRIEVLLEIIMSDSWVRYDNLGESKRETRTWEKALGFFIMINLFSH